MSHSEIQHEICSFIEKELLNDDSISLKPETPLLELGILDSLKMTELVAFIEQHYQISLMPEDISPAYFNHLVSISKLVVERIQQGKNAAA